MSRAVLYARYSSDSQRDASIEDQLRLCRLHAERQGWTVVDSYSDRAISGASLLGPGIQELIQDAGRGRFDIVLAEARDRLSRDQKDIAGLFKRLTFAGVRIVTLSEGDVSHLHVGLKGTMNALFLKDLADKTRSPRPRVGSEHHPRQPGTPQRRARQRALRRPAGLEPPAVPQGPGHGQADRPAEPRSRVDRAGGAGAADCRRRALE